MKVAFAEKISCHPSGIIIVSIPALSWRWNNNKWSAKANSGEDRHPNPE